MPEVDPFVWPTASEFLYTYEKLREAAARGDQVVSWALAAILDRRERRYLGVP